VAAANLVDPDIVRGKTLLGFRIPVCVASPFSRARRHDNHGHDRDHDEDDSRVISSLFDHTSVLKLIEWRWQLAPLTPRDSSDRIKNLAHALDFDHPDFSVPSLPIPPPPPPFNCVQTNSRSTLNSTADNEEDAWQGLLNSGLLDGWNLPL
jgi:phospholipase C